MTIQTMAAKLEVRLDKDLKSAVEFS